MRVPGRRDEGPASDARLRRGLSGLREGAPHGA
jgi:hypothetical protein